MKNPIAIVLAVFMFLSGSTVLAATVMKLVNTDDDGMVMLRTIQQIVSGAMFTAFTIGLFVVLVRNKRKK